MLSLSFRFETHAGPCLTKTKSEVTNSSSSHELEIGSSTVRSTFMASASARPTGVAGASFYQTEGGNNKSQKSHIETNND